MNDRILTQEEAETVDRMKIVRYLNSDLARRIRNADKVWREQGFIISMPAGEINPEWSSQTVEIMVHGVIDCIFMENNSLVLVDFKTGRFSGISSEREQYLPQMKFYARAIETYFGAAISEAFMYYFDNGITVPW